MEYKRRKAIVELVENNQEAFEQIIKNNLQLFHGTNSNALYSIIKNGLLSEHELKNLNNPILTGERWSRDKTRGRSFISFTDQFNTALEYATIPPSTEAKDSSFGIMIGISEEDISDLTTFKVPSDYPEIGVVGNISAGKIRTIFAPKDKIEYISKIIEGTNIELATCDLLLSEVEKKKYDYNNLQELVESRKKSGIKGIINRIKKYLNIGGNL